MKNKLLLLTFFIALGGFASANDVSSAEGPRFSSRILIKPGRTKHSAPVVELGSLDDMDKKRVMAVFAVARGDRNYAAIKPALEQYEIEIPEVKSAEQFRAVLSALEESSGKEVADLDPSAVGEAKLMIDAARREMTSSDSATAVPGGIVVGKALKKPLSARKKPLSPAELFKAEKDRQDLRVRERARKNSRLVIEAPVSANVGGRQMISRAELADKKRDERAARADAERATKAAQELRNEEIEILPSSAQMVRGRKHDLRSEAVVKNSRRSKSKASARKALTDDGFVIPEPPLWPKKDRGNARPSGAAALEASSRRAADRVDQNRYFVATIQSAIQDAKAASVAAASNSKDRQAASVARKKVNSLYEEYLVANLDSKEDILLAQADAIKSIDLAGAEEALRLASDRVDAARTEVLDALVQQEDIVGGQPGAKAVRHARRVSSKSLADAEKALAEAERDYARKEKRVSVLLEVNSVDEKPVIVNVVKVVTDNEVRYEFSGIERLSHAQRETILNFAVANEAEFVDECALKNIQLLFPSDASEGQKKSIRWALKKEIQKTATEVSSTAKEAARAKRYQEKQAEKAAKEKELNEAMLRSHRAIADKGILSLADARQLRAEALAGARIDFKNEEYRKKRIAKEAKKGGVSTVTQASIDQEAAVTPNTLEAPKDQNPTAITQSAVTENKEWSAGKLAGIGATGLGMAFVLVAKEITNPVARERFTSAARKLVSGPQRTKMTMADTKALVRGFVAAGLTVASAWMLIKAVSRASKNRNRGTARTE